MSEIEIKIVKEKIKKPRTEKQLAHTARLVAMNKERALKKREEKQNLKDEEIKKKKVIIKEIPLQNEKEQIYRKSREEIEKKEKLKKTPKKVKKVKLQGKAVNRPPTPPPSSDDEPTSSDSCNSTDSSIDSQDYECPPLSDDEPTPAPDYPENYHTDDPVAQPEPPAPIKRKRKVYR
tara:strand:+ start:168 stop:698 length:531 start_codon:yes stop_codon:yes gene_type:complete